VALSPAAGAAALTLAAILTDAAGLRLSGPGAWVAGVLALSGWAGFGLDRRRRRRDLRGSANAPTPDSP
jgi:hypothetical protein